MIGAAPNAMGTNWSKFGRWYEFIYHYGMSETTVKIDSRTLKDLKRIKRTDQSLTALIRDLLQAGIRRRKMSESADRYAEFLRTSPGEAEEMDDWASAPLERKPKALGKRRS